jgi:alpha-tubulin suppressor-like RCC1 family protein
VKRLSLALVVACGAPTTTTTSTVPIPLASSSATPPHVAALEHRPALSLLGYYQLCALAHGKLRCRSTMTPEVPLSKEPVVPGLETLDVKQASLGRDFACALLRDDSAVCWGGNHFGQLGANVRDAEHPAPAAVVNLRGVKSIFAGPAHACAVIDGGRVACWGKNQFGETGSSTQYLEAARELVEPQIVPGVDGVVDMALGWDATYAATSNGAVIAWGRRHLKEEPPMPSWTEQPRAIAILEGTTSLASSEEAYCGVQKDKLVCWGGSSAFERTMSTPFDVVTLPVEHPRRVCLSQLHGCVIDAAGAVSCFGLNTDGQLGVPPPANTRDRYSTQPPVKVPGVARAVDIACESSMSCALTASDEVFCWGRFDVEKQDDVHAPTRIAL